MTSLLLLAAACLQVVSACTNCLMLGKEEKAMFLLHSAACLPQSRAEPRRVAALLAGELRDDAALKRHVYCVLTRGKVVGKDGKLLKSAGAVLGKLARRSDGKHPAKILEQCAERSTDSATSPEEVAWNLFRCGYECKAPLDLPPAV